MRLTESYLALGVPAEAKKAAAVLGANYPGTIWYERAYKLIERNGDVREKREKRKKADKPAAVAAT